LQWKADARAAAQQAATAQAPPSNRQVQASAAKLKGNADYAAQNYQAVGVIRKGICWYLLT